MDFWRRTLNGKPGSGKDPLMPAPRISRRDLLRLGAAGVAASSCSGWIEALAGAARQPGRSCILLWMNGGPSQMDTFDLKPGHRNGGPFREINTSAGGLRISEYLPGVARHGHRLAVVRSLSTQEGDHGRATFLMRTGYLPAGPVRYPSIGSIVARELGDSSAALPACVSIAPYRVFSPAAFGPGFLGPRYAPLVVGDSSATFRDEPGYSLDRALQVQDIDPASEVPAGHAQARQALLREMQQEFLSRRPGPAVQANVTAYERAVRLMTSEAKSAFQLEQESQTLRDRYGRNLFGQGCLLARRLVERGVRFVEVTLGGLDGGGLGWDTHSNNFEAVRNLSGALDVAWSALMTDLADRGLLDSTLIIWTGEFGRTPTINQSTGRDHYPRAWSAVLAGGGIRGGQAFGRTSADGSTVEERPVGVPDFLATICEALRIDRSRQYLSNVGRPIHIVEASAQPIREVLA
jgi:hypothetical protein